MATYKYALIDIETGKVKLGPAGAGGDLFVDQYFTATNGQTIFTPSQVFSALSHIDVLRNGVEVREGASFSYQRNASLNRIIFNTGVLADAEIKIRIWL